MESLRPDNSKRDFPPVLAYYREFYKLKDEGVEYDSAVTIAIDLIDSLDLDEPIQVSLDDKILPQLQRAPINQEQALLELCLLPLETLGAKVKNVATSAESVKEWHYHSIAGTRTVMGAYYGSNFSIYPDNRQMKETENRMSALDARLADFAASAQELPDFSDEMHLDAIELRRQKDLAVVAALCASRLLSRLEAKSYEARYEAGLSKHISSLVPNDISGLFR